MARSGPLAGALSGDQDRDLRPGNPPARRPRDPDSRFPAESRNGGFPVPDIRPNRETGVRSDSSPRVSPFPSPSQIGNQGGWELGPGTRISRSDTKSSASKDCPSTAGPVGSGPQT